tara:strand:+ start:951 stop:1406 length:456 start_codon:yes stop_codon:yes gene_type:complete
VARSKTEAAASKVESAVALGSLGAGLGGPIGGAIGAGIGLYIGDRETVFPLDMVAIPAYQAYMINGTPSLQVYIRAGETLMPTGGNVEDVQQAMETMAVEDTPKPRKKTTAYQRKYKKAFAQVKPKHMKKDGTWKKGGFKAAVKAAHRMCK